MRSPARIVDKRPKKADKMHQVLGLPGISVITLGLSIPFSFSSITSKSDIMTSFQNDLNTRYCCSNVALRLLLRFRCCSVYTETVLRHAIRSSFLLRPSSFVFKGTLVGKLLCKHQILEPEKRRLSEKMWRIFDAVNFQFSHRITGTFVKRGCNKFLELHAIGE